MLSAVIGEPGREAQQGPLDGGICAEQGALGILISGLLSLGAERFPTGDFAVFLFPGAVWGAVLPGESWRLRHVLRKWTAVQAVRSFWAAEGGKGSSCNFLNVERLAKFVLNC